jgi:hypothetical protein
MDNDFELTRKKQRRRDAETIVLSMNTGELSELVAWCYEKAFGHEAIYKQINPRSVLRELKEITRVNA